MRVPIAELIDETVAAVSGVDAENIQAHLSGTEIDFGKGKDTIIVHTFLTGSREQERYEELEEKHYFQAGTNFDIDGVNFTLEIYTEREETND